MGIKLSPGLREISRKTVWACIVPAMVLPFVASLFYFVFFSENTFSRYLYSFTKLFTLVWPLVCYLFIFKQGFPKVSFKSPTHLKSLPFGIIVGILISFLIFGLMKTPMGEIVSASSEKIMEKVVSLGILDSYWVFAIFLSVIHSLIEEYYWRWFVYGQLRSVLNPIAAHALAALSFAAHHFVIVSQFFPTVWAILFGFAIAGGGLIWSLMYERQKSLFGIWISHMIVDLAIMWVGYRLIF